MSRQATLIASLAALLVLLAVSLPYLLATLPSGSGGPDGASGAVFAGFLLNPQDGHTYLAKMYQGWRGDWLYRLPFTAEPGAGVFLFAPYLFLGHVARWTGLPLIWVFHLARLAGAALLLAALWRFYGRYLPEPGWRVWSFSLAALGLGMGWLLLPTGRPTSDFWVAETYPFLSAFANPHFPLSLALLLWLLTPLAGDRHLTGKQVLAAALAGLLLSLLSPFALALAGLALAALWIVLLLMARFTPAAGTSPSANLPPTALWQHQPALRDLTVRIVAAAICGAPFSLYYLWITRVHPQLALWNAQNQTLTPAAWDVALSLSPALLLALPGAWLAARRGERQVAPLIAWAGIGLVFIYLPFGLQRRFMLGLYVPLVGLAGYALARRSERRGQAARRAAGLALALALPTTLLILLLGAFAARTQEPLLYLSAGEAQALEWLEANTEPDALVLAAPQTGLFIPGSTGRRVIYGHPYETANADAEQAAVMAFYQHTLPAPAAFLAERGVDYVFFGPRERAIGDLPGGLSLNHAFAAGDVTVYRMEAP